VRTSQLARSALCALVLSSLSAAHAAGVTLADFESGLSNGWTAQGGAWFVGGAMGSFTAVTNLTPVPSSKKLLNLTAANGKLVAASGEANFFIGPTSENRTGSLLSPGYSVTYDTLSWLSAGWSNDAYDGRSQFQILDSSLTVKASFGTAQSDSWKLVQANLLLLGFSPGDTFYFRAVDASTAKVPDSLGFAWMAFDNLQLSGNAVSPVPELPPAAMLGIGLLGVCLTRRRRLAA
jgi:hypothetical protein